jgi:hypothetical protein
MPTENQIITQVANEAFEALVAKGLHAMLFPLKRQGANIVTDTSVNLLKGYPIGSINSSGDSADSEEFQDQLRGGMYKTKIGGAVDPGDITFKAYFAPTMGKPKIEGIVNSMVFTPQFLLILARKQSDTELQGVFSAGVNYAGGNDIQGEYGKVVGSSLKFQITGEPKVGYNEVGTFPMSLYNGEA